MDARETKKATYNIDASLHQQLKLMASLQGREMVQIVEEALKSYLGRAGGLTETERSELATYEQVEHRGKGQWATIEFIGYAKNLGYQASDSTVAAELLRHLQRVGYLEVDVYDGTSYVPLASLATNDCLYQHGGLLHLRLTIPGRIRFEQMRQRSAEEEGASVAVVEGREVSQDPIQDLKSMLAESAHPLKLNDFMMGFVEDAIAIVEKSGTADFTPHPSQDLFSKRIETFDLATDPLASLFVVGCHWADAKQARTFTKALSRFATRPHSQTGAYYEMWDDVAKYPALRLLYAGGVAACANESFEVLHSLLIGARAKASRGSEVPLVLALHDHAVFAKEYWQWLPGMERHSAPVSDYLRKTLEIPFREVSVSDADLTQKFLMFEVFQALAYMDLDPTTQHDHTWAPPGTYFWMRTDLFEVLRGEIERSGPDWKPLRAGFFSGSPERAKYLLDRLHEFTKRVRSYRGV